MQRLEEVPTGSQSLDRFEALIGPQRTGQMREIQARFGERMAGRTIWNINSTAGGGGVAEMLRSLVAYGRGAGIDTRWLVIQGNADFFALTKRLHNSLHGWAGEGSLLEASQRAIYEDALKENAAELAALVRPRDVVLLHDPQTAGLVPRLLETGAAVIWRCHIGTDQPNRYSEEAWSFLEPYLSQAHAYVFTREAFIPGFCPKDQCTIIPPSIDPFSAKNQDLDEDTSRAILVQSGVVAGPAGNAAPVFSREDGSPGRVNRSAIFQEGGGGLPWDAPLVVQVSRWDRLKDPVGVLQGFYEMDGSGRASEAQLVLAGPDVSGVADDPEGAEVYQEVVTEWGDLPAQMRRRVHLVSLPMDDVEENAAMVNALQRHAAVIVQKSLQEGFGLTVTEAMWKGRPVVASAVGGIQDQIRDQQDGVLLRDPSDLNHFSLALRKLLEDRDRAEEMGRSARERVNEHYIGVNSLVAYTQLIESVDG